MPIKDVSDVANEGHREVEDNHTQDSLPKRYQVIVDHNIFVRKGPPPEPLPEEEMREREQRASLRTQLIAKYKTEREETWAEIRQLARGLVARTLTDEQLHRLLYLVHYKEERFRKRDRELRQYINDPARRVKPPHLTISQEAWLETAPEELPKHTPLVDAILQNVLERRGVKAEDLSKSDMDALVGAIGGRYGNKAEIAASPLSPETRKQQIAQMTSVEKLNEVLDRLKYSNKISDAMKDRIREMRDPKNVKVLVAVAAAVALANATGAGEAATAAMYLLFGKEVLEVSAHLISGVGGALLAESDEDLDTAADHLAEALSRITSDAAQVAVGVGIGKGVKWTAKKVTSSKQQSPKRAAIGHAT